MVTISLLLLFFPSQKHLKKAICFLATERKKLGIPGSLCLFIRLCLELNVGELSPFGKVLVLPLATIKAVVSIHCLACLWGFYFSQNCKKNYTILVQNEWDFLCLIYYLHLFLSTKEERKVPLILLPSPRPQRKSQLYH